MEIIQIIIFIIYSAYNCECHIYIEPINFVEWNFQCFIKILRFPG